MEFKTVIKIVSWFNPKKHIKNYINTIIDERVKLIITNEKLDNIAHQLTAEDIEYLKFISILGKNPQKIKFDDGSHIKLKNLSLINETFNWKRSNERLNEVIDYSGDDILSAYITLTYEGREIIRQITEVENKPIHENKKIAHDISKTRNTLINKFSQIK